MRAFGVIFAATLVARLSSLISFPVTARTLSVADMGDLTIWHSVRGLILLAVFIGLPDIVARDAGAHRNQRAFTVAWRISMVLLVAVALGMEVVLQWFPEWIRLPQPRLLLLAAVIDIVPGLFIGTLAAMGRVRAYALCIVAPALAASTLTVVLVSPPFSLGFSGPLYAHIASGVLNAGICLWLYLRHAEPADAEPVLARSLIPRALPVLGVGLVGMALATIDRYAVHSLAGSEALGYYAVVFQAAALLSFGGGAVRSSTLARIIRNIDDAPVIRRCFNDYLACGAMFAGMLALLSPEVVRILAGERYLAYITIAPALCATILALETFSFGQSVAVAQNQSHSAFRAISIAAAGAAVFVLLGTHLAGTLGTALGLLGAYAIAVVGVGLQRLKLSASGAGRLAGLSVLLVVLTFHYRDVAALHGGWSMALRYAGAAMFVALGLHHLRALGKDSA